MPAIAGVGPGIYGFTRGFEAGEESRQRGQAFESDQAIRRQRLGEEEAIAPLRRRVVEGGLEEQELRTAILKTNKKDQEKLSGELNEALAKRKVFAKALSDGLASGDMNHFARALTELYPDAYPNAEMVRNDDGSVTFSWGEGEERQSKVIRGRNINKETGRMEPITEGVGRDMSPDDEIGMMAPKILDPLGHFQKKLEEQYGLEKIGATGEWRVRAAETRAAGTVAAAEARATAAEGRAQTAAEQRDERATEAFYNRQNQRLAGMIKSEFGTPTLSGMIKGHQQFGDTEFQTKFQAMVEDELEEARTGSKRLLVGKAVEQAKEKVRTQYDTAYTAALSNARKLGPRVNWGDSGQLTQMADSGDMDARRLLQTINLVSKSFGTRVGQYMLKQIGADQKRRGTQRPRQQAVERTEE